MDTISGFPFFPVEFTKEGEVFKSAQVDELTSALGRGTFTDLMVLSHGWNNDMADARDLYEKLLAEVRVQLDRGSVPGALGRSYAVLGVFWPSKKFTDSELIPGGGAASVGGGAIDPDQLRAELDLLKEMFDDPDADAVIEQMKGLADDLEDRTSARNAFVERLRALLPAGEAIEDPIPERLLTGSGDEVIRELGIPVSVEASTASSEGAAFIGDVDLSGSASGSAAGLGEIFSTVKAGVRNLLNLTTYYTMKSRAGKVGRGGLNQVLASVRAAHPAIKIHLVGHSFGARLVTSAVDGPTSIKPSSMTLLQAAFSHNAFSSNYDGQNGRGFFRGVIDGAKVAGPILVSHTSKDRAVGLAYPLASRLSREKAAALGDENDVFGGLGRNGAQRTAEAKKGELLAVGKSYDFGSGAIFNLNADTIITGHSDIKRPEVAYALLCSIATT